MPLKPSYLLLTGAGAIVAYSGLKGKGIGSTTRDVIGGHNPQKTATLASLQITGLSPAATSGGGPGTPTGPLPTGSISANRIAGRLLAASYGWVGAEWSALDYGWGTLESGWNQYAANDKADPYNHAYGIPQANPGTKMASAGSNWKTSAITQIRWGLKYIKDTYGRPSQVPGWTGAGGYVGY